MASVIDSHSVSVELELEKSTTTKASITSSSYNNYKLVVFDVILRVFLFATTLASLVSLVASKQTEMIPVPFPPYAAFVSAKFTDSSAFIYSIAALSVTCMYSIITTLRSFLALLKRSSASTKLMFYVFAIDVLLFGILASATGAAGEVAYLGFKGNSNVGWHKICTVYDSYCRHLGFSVLTSIFASIVLSVLIILSLINFTRRHQN